MICFLVGYSAFFSVIIIILFFILFKHYDLFLSTLKQLFIQFSSPTLILAVTELNINAGLGQVHFVKGRVKEENLAAAICTMLYSYLRK